MKPIAVVRPYSHSIRKRVFALLRSIGFDVDSALVIPKATPDAQVIQALKLASFEALLVPFHAHRDSESQLVNGLALVCLLERAEPELAAVPIYMPISAMGMSSATLMLSRDEAAGGVSQVTRERILFMPEADLDEQQLAEQVRRHAHAAGSRGRTVAGVRVMSTARGSGWR